MVYKVLSSAPCLHPIIPLMAGWILYLKFQPAPSQQSYSFFLSSYDFLTSNESESCSVLSDSFWSHGLYKPWNFPGQNTGVGSLTLLQGIFLNSGVKPRSPTLQVDSLPTEPQGKPKNTAVGSLSLLQGIFPTQESNWGLLCCRQFFSNWAIREAWTMVSFD